MKFSPLALVVVAASAAAASSFPDRSALVRRGLSSIANTMINDVDTVKACTDNVTTALRTWNGSATGVFDILTVNTAVITALHNGTGDANSSSATFSLDDTESLGPHVQQLAYSVNASVATLIRRKPDFEKLGLAPTVVSSLQAQSNASVAFSDALLAKVYPAQLPIAEVLSAQPAASLALGIACFQGMNSSCNPDIVNASRTIDNAIQDGTSNDAVSVRGAASLTALLAALCVAALAL